MKSQESELMSAVRGNSQPCSSIALVQAITMYRNCSNIWQLTSLCQNQRSVLQMNVLYSSDCGKHLYWCSSSKTILSSIDHRSVTVLAEPETWNFYFVLFVHLGFEPSWFIFLSCVKLKNAYCKGCKRVMRLTTQPLVWVFLGFYFLTFVPMTFKKELWGIFKEHILIHMQKKTRVF